MEPDDLLCSRNARPEKALVGRAQWKINQAPPLKGERSIHPRSSTIVGPFLCFEVQGVAWQSYARQTV
jgi:hypothetical protein